MDVGENKREVNVLDQRSYFSVARQLAELIVHCKVDPLFSGFGSNEFSTKIIQGRRTEDVTLILIGTDSKSSSKACLFGV